MENIQENKKGNILVPITIVLIAAILILLFFLSPLKEMIFPSASEPELTLSVMESSGPDTETGLYRVVVKAEIKGKPEPRVTFNRNDGVGEIEADHALILLEEEETYLLRALATNSAGSAEAELELFAGIMIGTASGGADSGESADIDEPAPGSDEEEEEPDADLSSETSPDDDDGAAEPEGPRIVDISLLVGSGRVNVLEHPDESFPLTYEVARHSFSGLVEYTGEGIIDFQVEATHGLIDRVGPGILADEAPENLRPFVFSWHSPANPVGNLEALNVRITISTTDPFGACDTKVIKLSLLPEPEERPEMTGSYDPITTLTGQVNEDGPVFKASDSSSVPSIYVGDLATNIKVKGFISFDISELAGKNIISARMNIKGTGVGSPSAMPGNLGIYSTNYGNTLESSDYTSAVNTIMSYRPGFREFNINNDHLRNYIQSVATAGGTYAQFIMGYANTSNNGVADGLSILVQDISLEVTYN
jgi:hypothetical protein